MKQGKRRLFEFGKEIKNFSKVKVFCMIWAERKYMTPKFIKIVFLPFIFAFYFVSCAPPSPSPSQEYPKRKDTLFNNSNEQKVLEEKIIRELEILKKGSDFEKLYILNKIVESDNFYTNNEYSLFPEILVPYLVEIIKTKNDKVILNLTIKALGVFKKDSISALPFLIELLKKNNDLNVLANIGNTIESMGASAVKELVISLRLEILENKRNAKPKTSENPKNKNILYLVIILGRIGKPAHDCVPLLIDMLRTEKEISILIATIRTLGEMNEYASESIPLLLEILNKNKKNKEMLNSIIFTFNQIEKDTELVIPSLLEVLETNEDKEILKKTLIFISSRFGSIKSIKMEEHKKNSIPILTHLLKMNENKDMFKEILNSLDNSGASKKVILLLLFEKIEKEENIVSNDFAVFISQTIDKLSHEKDFELNKLISEFFEKNKNEFDTYQQNQINNKIKILLEREKLQNVENNSLLKDFFIKHYIISISILLVVLIVLLWQSVYQIKPLWLILFHEYLWTNSLLINIKSVFDFSTIPFISTICLRPRTIDAWIENNLESLKIKFEEKEIVKERSLYILVKVLFKNKNTDFLEQSFQEIFNKNQLQFLIYGDGGSGKTSLVCQMAQWAMNKSLFEKHYALPVLVENDTKDIQKTINEEIKILTDNENKISDALQKALLRKKRILLIVDGLSELSQETKQQVINNADINAVVYTSRNDEIKDVSKIETNNLVGGMVTDFLENYIKKSIGKDEKEKLFGKNIFDFDSGKLKELAGEKEISVLMAKLYAEQMIAQKQRTLKDDLPDNVPDLMVKSIEVLHNKEIYKKIEFSEVIKVSKIIAWECLDKNYRPLSVNKDKIIKRLEEINNGEELLKHLRDNLKIIEERGMEKNQIAFKLDPLAEYLAAIYLVKDKEVSKKEWNAFIKNAQQQNKKGEIKGFLEAVKGCCEKEGLVEKVAEIQRLHFSS